MTKMVFPKARLIVSACLFVGWIGFLTWLVARTRDPVILSRTQFLVADLFVIADVQACDGRPCSEATVAEVVWSAADAKDLINKTVTVEGLGDCVKHGWAGSGQYILALSVPKANKADVYEVTPLPSTPGYYANFSTVELVRPGPDPDKTAKLLTAHLSGVSAEQSQALVKATPPTVVRRNVPAKEAEALKKMTDAIGAVIRVRDQETRIYWANAEAREQLRELVAER